MIETTWGRVASLAYGRALTTGEAGDVAVYGTNGQTGWTDRAMGHGPAVVIGRKGAYRGVHLARGPFWVIDTAFYLRPSDKVEPVWAYYALRTADINSMDAGSAIPSTRRQDFEAMRVLVPPLPTQRAIAEVLGALDDKIATNAQVVSRVDELLGVRFRAIQSAADATGKLGDVLDLRYGKGLPATLRRTGSVPVFSSGGVTGSHDEAICRAPGVVVGRKGTAGSVYWADRDFYPIDTTFFVEPNGRAPIAYLFFLLRSLRLADLNADSAVPGLNRAEALAQPVRLPDASALQSFARQAADLMNRSSLAQIESAKLAELRDTLLPHLMSGRITVREAEQRVDEAL